MREKTIERPTMSEKIREYNVKNLDFKLKFIELCILTITVIIFLASTVSISVPVILAIAFSIFFLAYAVVSLLNAIISKEKSLYVKTKKGYARRILTFKIMREIAYWVYPIEKEDKNAIIFYVSALALFLVAIFLNWFQML